MTRPTATSTVPARDRRKASEPRWVGGDDLFDKRTDDVPSVDAELAELHYMGEAIGLSRAQVDEVIAVHTDWWGVGPRTYLDFSILSRSLANRATGQTWKPGEVRG